MTTFKPNPEYPRSRLAWLLALFGLLSLPVAATGTTPLSLALTLDLVADEYAAGVVEGVVVNAVEYGEAAIFLAEATGMAAAEPEFADLAPALAAVALKVEALAPAAEVRADLAAVRARLEEIAGEPLMASLPAGAGRALGDDVYVRNCQACHGAEPTVDLEGFEPPLFDAVFLADKSPTQLFTAVGLGIAGTPMEPWTDTLSEEERWSVVLGLWSLALGDEAEAGRAWLAGDGSGHLPVVAEAVPASALLTMTDLDIRAELTGVVPAAQIAAVAAAVRVSWEHPLPVPEAEDVVNRLIARVGGLEGELGNPEFTTIGLALYLEVFEPHEPRLRLLDREWTTKAESAFHNLLQVPEGERQAALDALVGVLEAGPHVARPLGRLGRFSASAAIIFREGLEAFLIVFVLLGFLRASARPGLARGIWGGVLSALAATAVVAVVAGNLLTAARAEVLEGATMLLAAGVLLAVSVWLGGQGRHMRWKTEAKARVDEAVGRNSLSALWGIAFLSVFREGLETVLFFQPLLRGTAEESAAVAAGFMAGVALLAIAGAAVAGMASKVPFGALFTGTGVFLFATAFVFAGQGILELQEGGMLGITPLPWAPSFPPLGMAPVLESVAAQALVLAVGLVAVWARRRAPSPA